jgi:hypothetical protein
MVLIGLTAYQASLTTLLHLLIVHPVTASVVQIFFLS